MSGQPLGVVATATEVRCDAVDVGRRLVHMACRVLYSVCGTGRLPKPGAAGVAWLGSPETRADVFGPDRPLDPWGRCYLANLGGLGSGGAVVVLSAGPNALIDTSIDAPEPQGDDVA